MVARLPLPITQHSVSGSVSPGPSSHSVRLPLSQGVLLLGGFALRVYTGWSPRVFLVRVKRGACACVCVCVAGLCLSHLECVCLFAFFFLPILLPILFLPLNVPTLSPAPQAPLPFF